MFLSLLADDWRTSRDDRAQEREALEEIAAELTVEAAALEGLRDQLSLHDRSAMWLLQRIGSSEADPDSVVARLTSIHRAAGYGATRAAYEGLRSTGRITLVRDPGLRRALVAYFEEQQTSVSGLMAIYGDVWMEFTESVSPYFSRFAVEGAESFGREANAPPPYTMELTTPWPDIPLEGELRYRLTTLGRLAAVIVDGSSSLLESNAELRRSIVVALTP